MNLTCPMCGHVFEAARGFEPAASITCPACGTAVTGGTSEPGLLSRQAILSNVQPPAICLMAVGAMMIVGGCLGGLSLVAQNAALEQAARNGQQVRQVPAAQMAGQAVGTLIGPLLGIGVILGGYKMYRLESHSSARLASILAMLPCSICCLFGLPIGIWSLMVLNDPTVKAAFR